MPVIVASGGGAPADGGSATLVAPLDARPMPPSSPIGRSHLSSTGTPHAMPEIDEAQPALPVESSGKGAWIAIAVVAVLGVGGFALSRGWVGGGGKSDPSVPASASTSASASSSEHLNVHAAPPTRVCPPGMASLPGGTLYVSAKGAQVSLDGFCLDANEVTVAEYEACVRKGQCNSEGLSSAPHCNYGIKGKERHPINCVDWDQAAAYCLSQSKRLPRSEEWEWAAHSGDRNTTYPWGDELPGEQMCWSGRVSRAALGTCEAGAHSTGQNAYAVQDLAGNVSEWVAAEAGEDDTVRPLLGDSWSSSESVFAKDVTGKTAVGARVSARKTHNGTIGFRCASAP
jgi:formylglycine-generating enzyme required for sulfatase activity